MEPRLVSYLYYFNVRRDYFECHEYGESLWLDSGRPTVLKGLIQAAVCLYHLYNGNVRGGCRMWERAKGYLAGSRPVYESIDLDALVHDIDDVFRRLPASWRTQLVPSAAVAALRLPPVSVHILDDAIAQGLPHWEPEPLHTPPPRG